MTERFSHKSRCGVSWRMRIEVFERRATDTRFRVISNIAKATPIGLLVSH